MIGDPTSCVCASCQWQGPFDDLEMVEDIFGRIEVGDTMPAGECPSCNGLAHYRDLSAAKTHYANMRVSKAKES